MRFKKGVEVKNLTPQLLLAMVITESVCTNVFRLQPQLFTSIDDGDHGIVGVPDEEDERTKHGKGEAFDMHTNSISRRIVQSLFQTLKDRLTPLGFDVIIENFEMQNEHIHVEYDPK